MWKFAALSIFTGPLMVMFVTYMQIDVLQNSDEDCAEYCPIPELSDHEQPQPPAVSRPLPPVPASA